MGRFFLRLALIAAVYDVVLGMFGQPTIAPVYWQLIGAAALLFSADLGSHRIWRYLSRALWRETAQEPSGWAPWVAGLLTVGAAIAFLEATSPYYFTQDDNFAQFGPVIIAASKSFNEGIFPTWNPLQMLGQPSTASGTYALTYPLTYLSYDLATWLFGSPLAFMEVFCGIHLIMGYVVTHLALRRLWRANAWLAAAGALAFVFSGYTLICGRSWYYMVPLVFWVPLVFYAGWRFLQRPKPGTALVLGAAIGCFFHAGNAQMWLYAICILGACAVSLMLLGGLSKSHLLYGALAGAVVLALDGPLLVTQARFVADISRAPWGDGLLRGMTALFLPFPFAHAPHPNGWLGSENSEYMTELYYTGTLQVIGAFLVGYLALRRLWRAKLDAKADLLLILVALSVVFALDAGFGPQSALGRTLASLPIFQKLSNPFKFMGLLNFYLVCLGTVALGHLTRLCGRWRDVATRLTFLVTVVLTGWHLDHSQTAFHTYGDHGFPALPPGAEAALKGAARIVAWTPWRSARAGYYETMPHNIPTVYGISQSGGYDPLVEHKPESRTNLQPPEWREYGIDTVVVATEAEDRGKVNRLVDELKLTQTYADANVRIYALAGAKPLVFGRSPGGRATDLTFLQDGVRFRYQGSATPDPVTVNFVYRDGLRAYVDSEEVPLLRDAHARALLIVPGGEHTVYVRYGGLWRFGYLQVALVAAIMLALLGWGVRAAKSSTG